MRVYFGENRQFLYLLLGFVFSEIFFFSYLMLCLW